MSSSAGDLSGERERDRGDEEPRIVPHLPDGLPGRDPVPPGLDLADGPPARISEGVDPRPVMRVGHGMIDLAHVPDTPILIGQGDPQSLLRDTGAEREGSSCSLKYILA